MNVSEKEGASAQPAAAVSAGETGDQEHLQEPGTSNTADDAGDEERGRLPEAIRRTWWFRLIIGIMVAADLLLAGTAVRYFLMGGSGWIGGVIATFFALIFGMIIYGMAKGGGFEREGPEPGAPIPTEVRRNWIWKAGLWWWFVWCVIVTIGAVYTVLRHEWYSVVGAVLLAVCSWLRLAIAAAGKVPPDMPNS